MIPAKRGRLFHASRYGMILGLVVTVVGIGFHPVLAFGIGAIVVCAILYDINWALTQSYARTIRRYPRS